MTDKRTPAPEVPLYDGVQKRYKFGNGYGASVVRHEHSYGGKNGLWELAVLDWRGQIDYDTSVTRDVIGFLSDADVEGVLDQIAALPPKTEDTW